jgi:outer membrane protein assembly factor BamB
VLKGEAETGRRGLISGLALLPDGSLIALDPQARAIDRWAADGRRLALLAAPGNGAPLSGGFGSAIVLAEGGLLLGEHLAGPPGSPFEGAGKVVELDASGALRWTHDTQWNGGVGGFLGVTHMALAADGRTLWHVSETGSRLYAHDIVAGAPLGVLYSREDPPGLLFGLAALPDGRIAVALGNALRLLDGGGRMLGDVALPEGRGWANLSVRPGGQGLWACDFYGGRVAELSLPDLAVKRTIELGNPQGCTSIAEVG